MEKAILILSPKSNNYVPQEYTKKTIPYLLNFLHSITINSIPFYTEWALNPQKNEQGAGNTASLYKKDNSIFIGFLYSDQPNGGPFFKISIKEFVKLLTEWGKLAKAQIPKIIITQSDNGFMTIKGEEY